MKLVFVQFFNLDRFSSRKFDLEGESTLKDDLFVEYVDRVRNRNPQRREDALCLLFYIRLYSGIEVCCFCCHYLELLP